jgi:hypothetical protein
MKTNGEIAAQIITNEIEFNYLMKLLSSCPGRNDDVLKTGEVDDITYMHILSGEERVLIQAIEHCNIRKHFLKNGGLI